MMARLCSCGSGFEQEWQYDARGIELCPTCPNCHDEKMKKYRKDVLEDPDYWHDEPIDED